MPDLFEADWDDGDDWTSFVLTDGGNAARSQVTAFPNRWRGGVGKFVASGTGAGDSFAAPDNGTFGGRTMRCSLVMRVTKMTLGAEVDCPMLVECGNNVGASLTNLIRLRTQSSGLCELAFTDSGTTVSDESFNWNQYLGRWLAWEWSLESQGSTTSADVTAKADAYLADGTRRLHVVHLEVSKTASLVAGFLKFRLGFEGLDLDNDELEFYVDQLHSEVSFSGAPTMALHHSRDRRGGQP